MGRLAVSEPHSLGQEAAIERLKSFGESLKAEHGAEISEVQERWADNVLHWGFKARGFWIHGELTVEPDKVSIQGGIPMPAMFFKKKIENTIRENLQKALA